MASTHKEPGPTARRIAEAIRRIRRSQDITTAELSRRLTALGQPIPETSITKAEHGTRRVDADDLVGLALALGISPNTLLMPDADWLGARTVYELTPAVTGTADELWQWAQGERPLPAPVPALPSPANGNQALEFIIRSRPYLLTPRPPGTPGGPERELTELAIAVTRAVKAGAEGAEIRRVAEMTLAQPPSARLSEDEMATWLEDRPRPERRDR
jgi:transcriptional regulator with XRE-family HTH domain